MKKLTSSVTFGGTLKGDKMTIMVLGKNLCTPVAMTIGTEEVSTEIELMIIKISIGLLGRKLTRNEEQLLSKVMTDIRQQYDQIQNRGKVKTNCQE